MATDRYHVEIEAMHVEIASDFFPDTFGPVLDSPYDRSPFDRPLPKTRWFYDWNPSDGGYVDEGFWMFPKELVDVEQANFEGYRIQVRAASAFSAEEIDFLYFGYQFSQSYARSFLFRSGASSPVLYASRLEQGSLLLELFAGAVVIGSGVSEYPKLREGVLKIVSDVQFIKRTISKSLRVSTELPLSERKEPSVELPYQKYRQIPHQTQHDMELRRDARQNRGHWNVAKDPDDAGVI